MHNPSEVNQPEVVAETSPRPRRGIALVFVLMFVVAMAALAMSSIFLASNANLLGKSYDKERDLKYAADAALQMGKSRVNADPSVLVMLDTNILDTLLLNQPLYDANNHAVAGITVSIFVGPTGSTSGQFGRFSTIVAVAKDPSRGNAFIRRLELTQESFAKFAYWSDQENQTGTGTIFFGGGDQIWGPVWSNDTISIHATGATFHDEVGTKQFVANPSNGTFTKGFKEHQKAIALPSTASLTNLLTISNSSGWKFSSNAAAPASNDESSVRDRIEFIAVDLNGATGDSTDSNEGLFKIFRADSSTILRGDLPAGPTAAKVKYCGDWHISEVMAGGSATRVQQFYPASVHNTAWFDAMIKQGQIDSLVAAGTPAGTAATNATNYATKEKAAPLDTIMNHPNARCYLPGDNHLVAIERNGTTFPANLVTYLLAPQREKGGMDTTFTPVGASGSWMLNPSGANAAITAKRGNSAGYNYNDANYLFPLDRLYNSNAKGVITFSGNVGLSGTVNGRVTLYAKGTVVILDDIRYANDPVKGICRDILGVISDKDIVIADNALLTPQQTASTWRMLDDTKDLDIHGVLMALGTSFRVERYNSGPTSTSSCGASVNGRGCINLSGGLIQNVRGAVGNSAGYGYLKRYTYDHCAVINPPPYFPTTGRFQDNRYLELDPTGFVPAQYFKSLTP